MPLEHAGRQLVLIDDVAVHCDLHSRHSRHSRYAQYTHRHSRRRSLGWCTGVVKFEAFAFASSTSALDDEHMWMHMVYVAVGNMDM